jgi:membrane protein
MREVFSKFFADRGTHLAAMIAYFALLSFVPLLFLALALLGFAGRADESSFLVTELNKAFPSSSVDGILKVVRSIQDNAATLGVIGAVFVGWTSLSLFSVLESAFNIVYGKPNRSFLHGKLLAVMLLVGSLVALFFGLLIGSVGYEILKRFAGSFFSNDYVAYAASILISTASVFVFLFAVYYLLTNEKLTFKEVLPGAIVSTIVLEASFQLLPIYLHLSKNVIALQAFGAPALLLVWLYLMANVIVFGAEVNWYLARGRRQTLEVEEAATGLAYVALFHPSSRWAHGTALPRSKTRSFSPPAQTPIVSLSGYTDTASPRDVEKSNVLAGASLRFMTLCAPAGPAGKRTRSPRSRVCSPSGTRTTTVPSTTSSHSSSYS